MSQLNKFNDFTERLALGVHNFGSHSFKVMLSNELPEATDAFKGDVLEITAGNGYSAGGVATTVSVVETAGTTTLFGTQCVFQATGGALPPFRYFILYNDTASGDPLVCWFDRGSVVSLQDGESLTFRFSGAANGAIMDLQ